MGIFYDPSSRNWQVTEEETNYETKHKTVFELLPENLNEKLPTNLTRVEADGRWVSQATLVWNSCKFRIGTECQGGYDSGTTQVYERYLKTVNDTVANVANQQKNQANAALNAQNKKANQINEATKQSNIALNKKNEDLNIANTNKNNAYKTTIKAASGTSGGDYVTQRQLLKNIAETPGITADFKKNLETNFKNFYRREKLQTWNTSLGADPPHGDFKGDYYKQQNPEVAQQWAEAVKNDDLDITEQYGENNFYWQHYTRQGKPAGRRGNPEEITRSTDIELEKKPTEAELQRARDFQLGIDPVTQSDRLIKIPEIAEQWEAAKNGDPYWDKLAKEKYLDVSKKDEFAALFRLSQRPEDKQVSFTYNINSANGEIGAYGVTQLEDALNQVTGEKNLVDVKRFGALAQNVLKDTIAEMKKAKVKEQTLSMMSGFGGFSEIMDINKTLTNSILGDSGVGGILSFTSAGKGEESLEKSLQKITGVQNNVTYNWQQWFDKTLKEKYNKEIELGYTTKQATEQVKIDGEFARTFIDKYLIPRFNTSRSMDEFVEYLDVRQEEQNPFQTQTLVDALKLTADKRAKTYLDDVAIKDPRKFNAEFYFNPTGAKSQKEEYANQAAAVAADWETAKTNPDALINPKLKDLGSWAKQAYRFGIDLTDKNAFARLHFELIGSMPKDPDDLRQGTKYDGADDILSQAKVQDFIYNEIFPVLEKEAAGTKNAFVGFFTPEEFADEMLRGFDPADTDSWNEVLQRYGLTSFKGTVEELKEYIAQTLRTGSAQDIREQIKYLNEKRKKPTQQVLGLTYIERPEDFKDEQASGDTELYKTFQSAGFQGTEDEFYDKFFPDLDRSEQTLLTKAGKNSALKTFGLDFSDPFASLGTVESFFADENAAEDAKNTDKDSNTDSSFFSLGSDEEDTDYKSATGQKILGEFTSLFKGL